MVIHPVPVGVGQALSEVLETQCERGPAHSQLKAAVACVPGLEAWWEVTPVREGPSWERIPVAVVPVFRHVCGGNLRLPGKTCLAVSGCRAL